MDYNSGYALGYEDFRDGHESRFVYRDKPVPHVYDRTGRVTVDAADLDGRKALADLRTMLDDARANGDNDVGIGRALPSHVTLDDGTTLEIGLVPASDGGLLMGVYQAVRLSRDGERLAKHMI